MKELSEFEKQAVIDLEKRMKSYEKKLQAQFSETLNSMRGEMAKLYSKYAKDGMLTRAEMTRYNKYITMEKQMVDLLNPTLQATSKQIQRLLPEMYSESFFEYAWAMDNGAGVRLGYGTFNPYNQAELFSITNPKNIEMANALKNYTKSGKQIIQSALLNALGSGKSYSRMIKDLAKGLGIVNYKALRILRTEGQRAINKGQSDLYLKAEEKGIEGNEVWDATLDNRTRATHGQMDGVKKSADGYFHGAIGKALYPLDPNLPAEESINCRCHTRFEIAGYSPQIRRTRDEGIIPYQDYTDWKKEYHPDWK